MASQLQPGSSSTGSTPAPLAGLGARGGRLARAGRLMSQNDRLRHADRLRPRLEDRRLPVAGPAARGQPLPRLRLRRTRRPAGTRQVLGRRTAIDRGRAHAERPPRTWPTRASTSSRPTGPAALGFEERFGLLVDAEWTAREQRKLQRRLRAAKLRHPAMLDAVDFTHPRRLNRQQVLTPRRPRLDRRASQSAPDRPDRHRQELPLVRVRRTSLAGGQVLHGVDEMGEVAAQAVELPDDEHVALPQGAQAVCPD